MRVHRTAVKKKGNVHDCLRLDYGDDRCRGDDRCCDATCSCTCQEQSAVYLHHSARSLECPEPAPKNYPEFATSPAQAGGGESARASLQGVLLSRSRGAASP